MLINHNDCSGYYYKHCQTIPNSCLPWVWIISLHGRFIMECTTLISYFNRGARPWLLFCWRTNHGWYWLVVSNEKKVYSYFGMMIPNSFPYLVMTHTLNTWKITMLRTVNHGVYHLFRLGPSKIHGELAEHGEPWFPWMLLKVDPKNPRNQKKHVWFHLWGFFWCFFPQTFGFPMALRGFSQFGRWFFRFRSRWEGAAGHHRCGGSLGQRRSSYPQLWPMTIGCIASQSPTVIGECPLFWHVFWATN